MPEYEKVDIGERLKIMRNLRAEYHRAPRRRKTEMLDMLVAVVGQDRKTIIRRLRGPCTRKARLKQRGRTYGGDVDDALRVIHRELNYVCPQLLQPKLGSMADTLVRCHEMSMTTLVREKLDRISVSTVQRHLKRIYQDQPVRRRAPGVASQARTQIPARRIPRQKSEPGHMETDLVHHCGPQASGEYVHTANMVDVATSWTALAAILGRSYVVMADAFDRCLAMIPFDVLEVHTDNGSEFFSAHILSFWRDKAKCPELSRSRPYHKNDNRFVEQSNGALVRGWLGHDRLDTATQTRLLNRIYEKLCSYHNYFKPVMRLKTKTFEGTKVKRTYDLAQTPFERLVATGVLSEKRRQELAAFRDGLNPAQLRRDIEHEINQLFRLPPAQDGISEDVYLTLLPHRTERSRASG